MSKPRRHIPPYTPPQEQRPVDYSQVPTPYEQWKKSRFWKSFRNTLIGATAIAVPYSLGIFDAMDETKPNGDHAEVAALDKARSGEIKGKGENVTVYVRAGANIRRSPYGRDDSNIVDTVESGTAIKITNPAEYNGFIAYQPQDADLGEGSSYETIADDTFWIDASLAGQTDRVGQKFLVSVGDAPTSKQLVTNDNNLALGNDGRFYDKRGHLASVGIEIAANEVPATHIASDNQQLAGPTK